MTAANVTETLWGPHGRSQGDGWETGAGLVPKGQGQRRNSDVTERLMEPEQILPQAESNIIQLSPLLNEGGFNGEQM